MITGKSSSTISKESTHDIEKVHEEKVASFYFYVLKDPRDGLIKYVGRTVDLTNRYRNHIYESKKNNRTKKERWIVKLLRHNLKPIMSKIYEKECTLSTAIYIESILVKSFGKIYDLKNMPDNYLGVVHTGKPVHMYLLTGEYIKTYSNSNQAHIHTSIKDSNILRCCKNENGYGSKTAGGHFWSFIKYDEYPHTYIINWRTLTGKPVIQYSRDMVEVNRFKTARVAEKSTGVSYKKVSAACNGRQKTAGNYIWKFESDMI